MKRYINSKTGASIEVPETMEISGGGWKPDLPEEYAFEEDPSVEEEKPASSEKKK